MVTHNPLLCGDEQSEESSPKGEQQHVVKRALEELWNLTLKN